MKTVYPNPTEHKSVGLHMARAFFNSRLFVPGDKVRCPNLKEVGQTSSTPPKECFPLMLPNEIQAEDLTSADLWLYRRTERPMDFSNLDLDPPDNTAEETMQNMTLSIKELVNWDLDKSFQRLENLGSRQITYKGKLK